jgi:predicted GIY-YIG superfamily endonuclease
MSLTTVAGPRDVADDLDVLAVSIAGRMAALSFSPDANLGLAFAQAARAAAELPLRDGIVYLLHFDRPYGHAAHYTGWTTDLDGRLAQHDAGRGARLLTVVRNAGIGWRLARTWPGTRATERALKSQGGASRRCPLCGINPRRTVRKGHQTMTEQPTGGEDRVHVTRVEHWPGGHTDYLGAVPKHVLAEFVDMKHARQTGPNTYEVTDESGRVTYETASTREAAP